MRLAAMCGISSIESININISTYVTVYLTFILYTSIHLRVV